MSLKNREQFSSTLDTELKIKLKKLSDDTKVPISKLLDQAVELLMEKRGAARDIPRPLGINIVKVADAEKPRNAERAIEVKVDPYEIDFEDFNEKPKKTKSNFIIDGIDIELNDPKGE